MNTKLHLERLPRTLELVTRDGPPDKEPVEGTLALRYIDQRLLPERLEFVETSNWETVVRAIKGLAIRGAPAIGVAGAAACALWVACQSRARMLDDVCFDEFAAAAHTIMNARPTAVNLSWGVRQLFREAERAIQQRSGLTCGELASHLYACVKELEARDEHINRAIGTQGATLLDPKTRVLTHCNAGSLATVFYGTALGVVYAAAEQGKIERVYADETRPVGQGARLTVWELARAGVPVTLLCDDMAASVMTQGMVDAVIVGADRIAANGDVANKIGTLGLAVLAREFGIPFYVAAPVSTLDFAMETGADIVIEQRDPREVMPQPLEGVDVFNPAFDVTPACYVTKIITERGVYAPNEISGLASQLAEAAVLSSFNV